MRRKTTGTRAPIRGWRLLLLPLLLMGAFAFATAGAAVLDPAGSGGPTIQSELADYNPGQTVTLSGANWDTGGSQVHIVVNDDVGQTWQHATDVTPSADGTIADSFQLPTHFVAVYSVRATQQTESGTLEASSSFTDANASGKPSQCANDPAPSPSTDGCTAAGDWVTGNVNAAKAVYFEGDSISYRIEFGSLSLATHTVTIKWDTTKGGTHAIDYLTTFDRTVATADPCAGVSGCSLANFTTFPVPADPQVTGAGVTPIAGNFTLYGGTITSVGAYSYPDGTGFTGDKSAQITISFTASVANPVLAWGGHISTRHDWGPLGSAVAIPGSPYHTTFGGLDGSGGGQDLPLATEAVIFPGSITVIKDATPNGATSFPFSVSPALGSPPETSFSLVDDGTSANTKTYSGITNFTTYTVSETVPTNWGFDSASCSVTTPNGGSATAGQTTTINMKEGEDWTCTYLDSIRVGTLIVKKHVVNDNGGTKAAGDFTLHVKSGGTDVSSSPAAGSESGTSYTLNGGTYVVSENAPPTGYTQTGFSGDCDSNGSVTLAAGQTKTCTITNDDVAPKLHLRKVVKNDNGGSATVADFTLTADGTGSNDLTGESPVDSGTTLQADTWTLSETTVAGYTASDWVCAGGTQGTGADKDKITVGISEEATCTITNDDQQAYITVVKVVNNDHGGTAAPNDFSLTLEGNAVSSGVAVPVNPGTYTAGETQLSGYTFDGFSGDCDSGGDVTVALGESKTCTLTNDDQQATITVVKNVTNDNGGSAQPDDFKLTLDGNATTSGTIVPVNPGTYLAGETLLSGYSFSGYTGDCDSNGAVTVALGEHKTCTLTNDDQPGTLIVKKLVVNANGGTKAAGDFAFKVNGGASTAFDQAGDGDNNALTGENHLTVDAGTYTVVEDGLPITGYATSYGNCSNVVVGIGETKTCLVTNDDIQPKLTLVKTVVNDNGGTLQVSDFPLFVDQTSVLSSVKNGFDAGTYTASETQQAGYAAGSWGGDCAADGSITLHVGDDKTCTITNDDIQPKLTLVKTVVNDNGGTKQVSDFPLFVGQTSMISGVAHGFNAGSYTASETGQYGYTAGAWGGDCAANGSITLAVGDDKTCTITNDDQPGTIIVKKLIKPVGSLTSFSFQTTGAGYTGFSLSGGAEDSQTLNAGSYTVQELVPLGWVLTGIGGSSDPNTPYDCTVTGSGGSTGIGDLNTQTATVSLKNGDTVTCVFENTGQGVTRTQGFWATHPQLSEIAWFGGTAFGHTFPGVANVAGIGDAQICGRPIDTLGKLMGGFWSSVSKTSTGAKRSSLDQARMQLLQQLLAAELNASAFGTVPSGGSGMFAQWEAALCGTNVKAISTAQGQAASFNTQGDSGAFTPGTSADSKYARSIANIPFWNVIKP